MLSTFMQKQTNKKKQKKLIETMIISLNISSEQKDLYIQAMVVLTPNESETLFENLTRFIEKIELKEIQEIKKESFVSVAGMRKKEAEEKAQEMNSFSFLLHNL
jgi:wyosine [tRNA(Phe)-imidazoG37] synthetase (radical SAM superfamily)